MITWNQLIDLTDVQALEVYVAAQIILLNRRLLMKTPLSQEVPEHKTL